jgi:hypothetical protein
LPLVHEGGHFETLADLLSKSRDEFISEVIRELGCHLLNRLPRFLFLVVVNEGPDRVHLASRSSLPRF